MVIQLIAVVRVARDAVAYGLEVRATKISMQLDLIKGEHAYCDAYCLDQL